MHAMATSSQHYKPAPAWKWAFTNQGNIEIGIVREVEGFAVPDLQSNQSNVGVASKI